MISKEFAEALTRAFEGIEARLKAIEEDNKALHETVDNKLIGGLQAAAEEFDNDCKYSDFYDKYKDKIDAFKPSMSVLYGEDFDLPSNIFDTIKDMEGYGAEDFDEAGKVDEILASIDEKIKALQDLKEEVKEEDEVKKEKDDLPDEEDLSRIYDEYNN